MVTDKPVFFVGGGKHNAKPRAGYEVAVIQLLMDEVGLGSGRDGGGRASEAQAARRGVQIDDYADEPIKLVTVSRKIP